MKTKEMDLGTGEQFLKCVLEMHIQTLFKLVENEKRLIDYIDGFEQHLKEMEEAVKDSGLVLMEETEEFTNIKTSVGKEFMQYLLEMDLKHLYEVVKNEKSLYAFIDGRCEAYYASLTESAQSGNFKGVLGEIDAREIANAILYDGLTELDWLEMHGVDAYVGDM